jgi:hypothetical protein
MLELTQAHIDELDVSIKSITLLSNCAVVLFVTGDAVNDQPQRGNRRVATG